MDIAVGIMGITVLATTLTLLVLTSKKLKKTEERIKQLELDTEMLIQNNNKVDN